MKRLRNQAQWNVLISGMPALLVTLGIVLLIVAFVWSMRLTEFGGQDADEKYRAAEKATSIADRQKDFNEALKSYLAIEEKNHPRFGSGSLYYNIGNTYYQLGEYPEAILYYLRAQALMPREQRVENNLQAARGKLSLHTQAASNPFAFVFFFHSYLSLPERIQLFFGLCLTAFIFASVYIWKAKRWGKIAAIIAMCLATLILISLAYTHFFAPIDAVMVKSVSMRRDAGEEYAKANDQPIPAGTKVEVLGTTSDGSWYKVSTPNRDFGYVPQNAIRLVGI